uniref:Cytochrome c oxidase subunit 5A, mitochondrial n=1 Tax=Astyanax mexicanus TaxID=7994 RepID=A0A8B9GUW5_ASTMX
YLGAGLRLSKARALATDEEFDARWVTYFSKPDLDAWELRKVDIPDHFYDFPL